MCVICDLYLGDPYLCCHQDVQHCNKGQLTALTIHTYIHTKQHKANIHHTQMFLIKPDYTSFQNHMCMHKLCISLSHLDLACIVRVRKQL